MQKYLDQAKAYVIDKINISNYPQGHPFLQESFEYDFILYVLAIIRCSIHSFKIDHRLLDDYLCEKLRSNQNGVFDLESYYQNLNEVIFFYYLLMGLVKRGGLGSLDKIDYEPPGVHPKILEYSFLFNQNLLKKNVNFEVKTITCDPFMKDENIRIKNDQKLIKKFFHDVDLTKCLSESELYDYTILESSTHFRQLSKHIKKINGKFEKRKDSYNIGVIVIQFATSLEEFFAYLFHPNKGLLFQSDFSNMDCLIFFSLTATPDVYLNEVYDKSHVFSLLFNEESNFTSLLKGFRLDNYASINHQVLEPYSNFANQEFGKYLFVIKDGIGIFVDEDADEEVVAQYTYEISQKLHGKNSI